VAAIELRNFGYAIAFNLSPVLIAVVKAQLKFK
jgi:hypothetical protein